MGRLQLTLRVVNACSAALVTRAVLSYHDAHTISLLLKAVSMAGAVSFLDLGAGQYLQVRLVASTLDRKTARRMRQFLIVGPLAAAVALGTVFFMLWRPSGTTLVCAGCILMSGAFGLGTTMLNQLAFSQPVLTRGVQQQILASALGCAAILGADAADLSPLIGAATCYALTMSAAIANTWSVSAFLRKHPGADRSPSFIPPSGMAWFSLEAIIDPLVLAAITYIASTEQIPDRLRLYALILRVTNTVCAVLILAYMSLWGFAGSANALRLRIRATARLAAVGPVSIVAFLTVFRAFWVPLFLKGNEYNWDTRVTVLFLALLTSRTVMNFVSVCGKLANAQHLITMISVSSAVTGVAAFVALRGRVYPTLLTHSVLLVAASTLAFHLLSGRFRENTIVQPAP